MLQPAWVHGWRWIFNEILALVDTQPWAQSLCSADGQSEAQMHGSECDTESSGLIDFLAAWMEITVPVVQKFGISIIFSKEINTFIQQKCIKMVKRDREE